MNARQFILLSISLGMAAAATAGEDPARRAWRPATAADGQRPVPASATQSPDAGSTPAQRAYVDPQTGALIPAPAIPPEPQVVDRTALKAARARDRPLQVTPEGYLYVDTSDYQMLATAHIGPDGQVHRNCRTMHDASAATATYATSGSGKE